jgi:hypothetical protein
MHLLFNAENIDDDFDYQWRELRKRKKKSSARDNLNHKTVAKFSMKNEVCFFLLCHKFNLTEMIEEWWYKQWETQDKNKL